MKYLKTNQGEMRILDERRTGRGRDSRLTGRGNQGRDPFLLGHTLEIPPPTTTNADLTSYRAKGVPTGGAILEPHGISGEFVRG